jgi:hypothetical protein
MPIGDVDIQSDEQQMYRLNFGVNAICRLEDKDGRSYGEILEALRVDYPSMRLLRLVVWAGLPETTTLEEAGRALDALGPVTILAAIRGVLQTEPTTDTAEVMA